MESVLEAALRYAELGIPVLPCEPSNKQPIGPLVPPDRAPMGRKILYGTGGCKKATTDPGIIRGWWELRPDAMIGIATGAASGFFVIDIDTPKQVKVGQLGEMTPDGVAAWAALGIEVETFEVRTASGGVHKYFRYDPARPISNKEGSLRGRGVNVRGTGGYVIAPPSVNATGGRYAAKDGLDITDAAPAPEALYAALRARAVALAAAPRDDNVVAFPAAGGTAPVTLTGLSDRPDFPMTFENRERLRAALTAISADDRQTWFTILAAINSLEPEWGQNARTIAEEWSKKSSKFDAYGFEKAWRSLDPAKAATGVTVDTIFWEARGGGDDLPPQSGTQDNAPIGFEDFLAYRELHNYIFRPTRALWPGGSVNAALPKVQMGKRKVAASYWLDRNQPVEQLSWAPGLPEIIRDHLVLEGGLVYRKGLSIFNLYIPPPANDGDPGQAGRWLDHVRRVFPDDADHIIKWCAFRVQFPDRKVNHALVLGGAQGIGKDTCLEPVKHAVGHWNFREVKPTQIMHRFNPALKSVILRISEGRDLGDVDRYQFYDHLKDYIASPPDVLRIDEKNLREYVILNCTGIIITTNHKHGGLFLPPDDRRHYVAWSELQEADFAADYFPDLYNWYDCGGAEHAAAYLHKLNVRSFDPKAPPPKTAAWRAIVGSNASLEETEITEIIEALGEPDAVLLSEILMKAAGTIYEWLTDRKNRRIIPKVMDAAGYAWVANPYAKDGLWRVAGKHVAGYAKKSLPYPEQVAAMQRKT